MADDAPAVGPGPRDLAPSGVPSVMFFAAFHGELSDRQNTRLLVTFAMSPENRVVWATAQFAYPGTSWGNPITLDHIPEGTVIR